MGVCQRSSYNLKILLLYYVLPDIRSRTVLLAWHLKYTFDFDPPTQNPCIYVCIIILKVDKIK